MNTNLTMRPTCVTSPFQKPIFTLLTLLLLPLASLHGAMIFVTAYHFTDAYCLHSMTGTESTEACKAFIQNCGIPETMVTDGHNSLFGAQWTQLCRDRGMKQFTTEPYSHRQNLAEAGIRELKRLYRKISHNVPIPPRYWFYLLRYCCDIRNRTALDIYGLGLGLS